MSVSPSRPTLLLIHGAWQGAWVWDAFQQEMQQRGWPTHAVDLPGNGHDDTPPDQVNLDRYVQCLTDWIDAHEGPVVLVGHSGGGVVASQTAEARPDRVQAIVYLAGMMLPSGVGFGEVVQAVLPLHPAAAGIGPYLQWSPSRDMSWVPPEAAQDIFLHDCPPDVAEPASRRLVPQPEPGRALVASLTSERWGRIPRVYVEALYDRSVILPVQRHMQALCPGATRLSMATGHAPHVAAPASLAQLLDEALPLVMKSGQPD